MVCCLSRDGDVNIYVSYPFLFIEIFESHKNPDVEMRIMRKISLLLLSCYAVMTNYP